MGWLRWWREAVEREADERDEFIQAAMRSLSRQTRHEEAERHHARDLRVVRVLTVAGWEGVKRGTFRSYDKSASWVPADAGDIAVRRTAENVLGVERVAKTTDS